MIAADYLLLKPNWTNKITITRKWETNIQTAVTGDEIRSALFTFPRRRIQCLITGVNTEETNTIKSRLFRHIHNPIGVGIWTDGSTLTSSPSSGSTSLSVESTLYRNFDIGGLCVLVDRYSTAYEVCEISSLSANTIGLSSGLSTTWPLPADVYPVIQCRFGAEQSINFMTSRVGQIRIDVEEVFDPDIQYAAHTIPASFPTYRQLPILTVPPNWITPVEVTINHPYEWVQFYGKHYSTSYRTESEYRVKHKYLRYTRQDIFNLCEFFDGCKGRFSAFWVPTWIDDLRITNAFSIGSSTLPIADYFYTGYWENTEVTGKHVRISFPTGEVHHAEIVGATNNSISIDPAVPKGCTVAMANSVLVSFLLLARFSSDSLQVDHEAEAIANIVAEFKSVPIPTEGGTLPAIWEPSFNYSTWQGTSYGWTNYNLRLVIPASSLSVSGNGIKVTLGHIGANWEIASLYIGHQSLSGNSIDFAGTPIEVTFGGSSGGTVTSGGLSSDLISFSLDSSRNLVFSLYFDSADADIPSSLVPLYSGEVWYYEGDNEADVAGINVSNYTNYSDTENLDAIQSIDIYTG